MKPLAMPTLILVPQSRQLPFRLGRLEEAVKAEPNSQASFMLGFRRVDGVDRIVARINIRLTPGMPKE
jgi:hypothetical protein